MANLPKIQDLYSDLELAKSTDVLVALLNQPPKSDWVKTHPYIAGYKYLPIDKIEYLLKKIFKQYRIEVIREGTAFNGVYVVVRVWYMNPITGLMDYHDGIGAKELQVKKGSSAADLSAINAGALAMAFPIAKTVAIKDACDHFGSLFGSDLNRKDTMSITVDETLQNKVSPIEEINAEVKQEAQSDVNNIEVAFELVSKHEEEVFEVAPAAPLAAAPVAPAPPDDDF